MSEIKRSYKGLILILFMGLGIYLGYYQENQNLINLGIFITYINSVLLFIGSFGNDQNNENKQNHKFTKLFIRVVLIFYILALAYKAEYIHSTIWLFFLLSNIIKNKITKD
jgi:hypothetical protein